MARTDLRQIAADARRLAASSDQREANKLMRDILSSQYERGKRTGRAEVEGELGHLDLRRTLLEITAEVVEMNAARVSAIPNSTAALRALGEAGAILRDAVRTAEPPEPEPEPEDEVAAKREATKEPPKRTRSRAKKS